MKIYPSVSLIIPTIGRNTLERTLRSVVECNYPNLQVIIVSYMERKEYIIQAMKQIKDINFTLHFADKKLLPGVAKNIGLSLATGSLITCLDDDDTALPAKFFKLSEFLENNPEYYAVFGKYNVRNPEGKIVNTMCGGSNNVCFETLLQNNYIASGSIMYRRTDDLRFPDVPFGFGEDWSLHLDILGSGKKIGYIPEPIYVWTMANGFTKEFNRKGINWKQLVEANKRRAIEKWRKK